MDPRVENQKLEDEKIAKLTEELSRRAQKISVSQPVVSPRPISAEENVAGFPPTVKVGGADNDPSIKALRTYRNDTAEAIERKNESILSMNIAEQKRRGKNISIQCANTKSYKTVIIFICGLLVAAGFGTLAFFYYASRTPTTVPIQNQPASLQFVKQNLVIEHKTRTAVVKEIEEFTASAAHPDSPFVSFAFLEADPHIPEATVAASVEKVMTLLAPHIPSYLVRSLKPDYTVGIHTDLPNKMFIILNTESFDSTFAGMLEWEKNIVSDLSFIARQNVTAEPAFKDVVLKNKDVRALYDTSGQTILLYSFLDRETLLIASDETTLAEVNAKLINFKSAR